jgi:hypothetical protein
MNCLPQNCFYYLTVLECIDNSPRGLFKNVSLLAEYTLTDRLEVCMQIALSQDTPLQSLDTPSSSWDQNCSWLIERANLGKISRIAKCKVYECKIVAMK